MRRTILIVVAAVGLLAASTAGSVAAKKQSLYFPESMLQEIKDEAGATVSRKLKDAGVELATGDWTESGQRGLHDGNTLVMSRSGTGSASGGERTDYEIVSTVEPVQSGKKHDRKKHIVVVGSKVKEQETVGFTLAVEPDPRSGGIAFNLLLSIEGRIIIDQEGTAGNLERVVAQPDVVSAVRTLERGWGIPKPTIGLDLPVVWHCCGQE